MKRAVLSILLLIASVGLAGCVDAFESAAEAVADAAANQCNATEAESGGRVYMGLPRDSEVPVHGPGVLTIVAEIETMPIASGTLELLGPDGERVWGLDAGFGSGGARGDTTFTNPTPGMYTVHVEGAPFADFGFLVVVVSCGSR